MPETNKSASVEPEYEEDVAVPHEAAAGAYAAKVAIDDMEPLDEMPPMPPGDGLDMVRHTVFDCVAICQDDLAAGLLLFKMILFARYSKLEIDGKRYYVRSRAKLCRDVRLTRHQYNRALSVLKELGFVETRKIPLDQIHIFGPFTAFRVTKLAATNLKSHVKKQAFFKSQAKKKAGWE